MKELEATIRAEGWTVHIHKRRKKQLKYVYAAKRQGNKIIQVYIAPEAKITGITPEQVRNKLQTKIKTA